MSGKQIHEMMSKRKYCFEDLSLRIQNFKKNNKKLILIFKYIYMYFHFYLLLLDMLSSVSLHSIKKRWNAKIQNNE
jgi:hypothetical protein